MYVSISIGLNYPLFGAAKCKLGKIKVNVDATWPKDGKVVVIVASCDHMEKKH